MHGGTYAGTHAHTVRATARQPPPPPCPPLPRPARHGQPPPPPVCPVRLSARPRLKKKHGRCRSLGGVLFFFLPSLAHVVDGRAPGRGEASKLSGAQRLPFCRGPKHAGCLPRTAPGQKGCRGRGAPQRGAAEGLRKWTSHLAGGVLQPIRTEDVVPQRRMVLLAVAAGKGAHLRALRRRLLRLVEVRVTLGFVVSERQHTVKDPPPTKKKKHE